jgi:hypothetical protein
MEEFPANSRRVTSDKKADDAPRKIEPVITGKVIRRKKPLTKRLRDTFFAGDGNSVFGYLVRDVLIPALQATATDLVTKGINKAVYGTDRPPHGAGRTTVYGSGRPTISYDRYSSSRPTPATNRPSPTPSENRPYRPSSFQLGEIILETRMEAEDVASKLFEILEEYKVVRVADLNDLIHEKNEYTDHKFGWDSLRGLDIRRIREGYLLVLPDPEDLR